MKPPSNISLPIDLASPDQLSVTDLELADFMSAQRSARVRGNAAEAGEMSVLLGRLLRVNNVDSTDLEALESIRRSLSDLLNNAPVAHLTLAALPQRSVKRQITVWFRTQIHPQMLLTFAGRYDLGGGALIFSGSHVYDYTFRRHILDNKKRIAELTFSV